MSLYNMVNGVNQATFFILPMLGKHPDEYPRFRDCFPGRATNSETEVDQFGIPTKDFEPKELFISVYTRVGGGNRDDYTKEIGILRSHPEYVEDYDDDFDCTFATFVFRVPKKWVKDYKLLVSGKPCNTTSEAYKKLIKETFPKLRKQLDELFS